MRTAWAYQMWYQSEVKPTKYWIFHHTHTTIFLTAYSESRCS